MVGMLAVDVSLFIRMYVLLVALLFVAVQGQDCPFHSDACPVELDNALDLFYYDINDRSSCQHQCNSISACNHFTMLPTPDNKHIKCFLFAECGATEPCKNCISGEQEPPYYDCVVKAEASEPKLKPRTMIGAESYTCTTDVDNVVDIYYFDVDDSESCQHQCTALSECSFWTQFEVSDSPHPHNKCFLYAGCDKHESCAFQCVNGASL